MRGDNFSTEPTFLESLECRIAPAAAITFTDMDGDLVTVKSSKGTANDLAGALIFNAAGNVPKELQAINLGAAFAGTNLSVTTSGGGNGEVNVGRIGSNFDIGKITVQGDLGAISVGDMNGKTAAMKSLEVDSFYRFGQATGALSSLSALRGSVGSIIVHGSVHGALIQVSDGAFDGELTAGWRTDLKQVKIGGSLLGFANGAGSGSVQVEGSIGNVSVAGDLKGNEGDRTGAIFASRGSIGKVWIGGDILGGAGHGSGSIIAAGALKTVEIAKNVTGSTGAYSGSINAFGIGKALVGGDLTAGTGAFNGSITSSGTFGSATVLGSVVGGSITGYAGTMTVKVGLDYDGGEKESAIKNLGTLKVDIGRDFIGGGADYSGQIVSDEVLTVHIHGDLIGGDVAGTQYAGFIRLAAAGSKIVVDGTVLGGTGDHNGSLETLVFGETRAAKISINVAGDLLGGAGTDSGRIYVDGTLASLSIGGELRGGGGVNSGQVHTTGGIGKASVGDSINASVGANSGAITTLGDIKSLTIENDVWGKEGLNYVQIGAAGAIGSLVIHGNAVQTIITALGDQTPSGKSDVAIKKLAVAGNFTYAAIYSGYDLALAEENPDAQIGSIHIGSTWSNSKVVTGSRAGADGIFGTQDDRLISNPGANSADIVARISSIVLDGVIIGANNAVSAQEVGKMVVGSYKLPLNKGPNNDFFGGFLVENA